MHPGTALYGTDRVFLEAVAGFIERDMEVRAVLPDAGALADALIDQGIDVMVVPNLGNEHGGRVHAWTAIVDGWFNGSALVRRVLDDYQPDLLYVSTAAIPQWPKVAEKLRIPVLLHLHDLETSATAAGRRMLYAPAAHADRVLAASRHGRDSLLQASPELADDVEVVHNPIPGPRELIAARARIEGAARIGFIGRLTPQKGADLLIEAVADLVHRGRDLRLDIVGDVADGDGWFREQLDDLILSTGITGRVEFRGFLDSVWESLASFDVLVVPSRIDEAFNTTAAEGALALRPVIVSDLPGTRETLRRVPAATFVEPGSPQPIAEAIERLLENWQGIAQLTMTASDELAVRHDPATFRGLVGSIADEVIQTARSHLHRDDIVASGPSRGRETWNQMLDDSDAYDTRPRV